MDQNALQKQTRPLRRLIAARLGIRARNLRRQLSAVRRHVPAWMGRDLQYLAQAEDMARHPKLARLIDDRRLSRGRRRLTAQMRDMDRRSKRADWWLDIGGVIATNTVIVALLVIGVLVWRGLL